MVVNKPSFLHHSEPLRVAMLHTSDLGTCASRVRTALYDGADAFGFQFCHLPPEMRTDEVYRQILAPMGDKPLYATNYRDDYSSKNTEEERAEELLHILRCGATLIDVMGDHYDPQPQQMTWDATAIARQRELIHQIHEEGGEVIMSCHTGCFLEPERVLALAQAQEERGADIVKIVTNADTEEEQMANLEAIHLMKRELNVPFLFLANGRYYKMQRMIGPMLGVCMWLCVVEYTPQCVPTQPLLRAVSQVVANFDYHPEK